MSSAPQNTPNSEKPVEKTRPDLPKLNVNPDTNFKVVDSGRQAPHPTPLITPCNSSSLQKQNSTDQEKPVLNFDFNVERISSLADLNKT